MKENADAVLANRWAVLLLLLAWSWIVMTVCHELGHVVGGCCCGARVTVLELRPWEMPYSLYSPDPNPQVTVWAGPLLGCLVPMFAAIIINRPAVWFVGWFCVLANATYLLIGYVGGDSELDTTKILNAGTPEFAFWLFLAITGPVSYIKFRTQCILVMSTDSSSESETESDVTAMSRAAWKRSLVVLVTVVAAQSVLASLL